MEIPKTRYLEHDGVNIAWQLFGDGPAEILLMPGWVSHIDHFWDYADPRAWLTEVGRFARVAIYDKPGTGASDPIDQLPPLEKRVEQVLALMDAAGMRRPTVVAVSEGGITACLAAAARPERVDRLVLLNSTVTGFDRRGMEGTPEEVIEERLAYVRLTAERWGEGIEGHRWLPSVRDPDNAWGRLQRACSTRSVARGYLKAAVDGMTAWDVLPAIHQPVLVMHDVDDPVLPVQWARNAAARIPHARLIELPGNEHLPWLGDTTEMLRQIRAFVGAPAPAPRAERVLATILFTDIVGSTDELARVGDAAWSDRLDRHTQIVTEGLHRFDGNLVKSTGDGALATFSGPARGVGAARWILDELGSAGLQARAGVHVGEIEQQNGDIAGLAVHVAARVMGKAGDDEVLVSRTVRDLTAGSELRFADRGTHALKGVPEEWQLYALT